MSDTPIPAVVKVRSIGGAYLARCQGKTASCTMSSEHAAAAAAGKHFGILSTRIHLHQKEDGHWLALPGSVAPAHWQTAESIAKEWVDRMMNRFP